MDSSFRTTASPSTSSLLKGKASAKISCAKFRQDGKFFAVGSNKGVAVWRYDCFEPIFQTSIGGIVQLAMHDYAPLLAVCGGGNTPACGSKSILIIDFESQASPKEISFMDSVVGMAMTHTKIVVMLQSKSHILDLANMKLMQTVDHVPMRTGPIMAVSCNPSNHFAAFPSEAETEVRILDLETQTAECVFKAHNRPISCMAMNHLGTLVATASTKGTVVRVFSVPHGQRLFKLRRGASSAAIKGLSFSLQSPLLMLWSNKETLHMWKLDTQLAHVQSGGLTRSRPAALSLQRTLSGSSMAQSTSASPRTPPVSAGENLFFSSRDDARALDVDNTSMSNMDSQESETVKSFSQFKIDGDGTVQCGFIFMPPSNSGTSASSSVQTSPIRQERTAHGSGDTFAEKLHEGGADHTAEHVCVGVITSSNSLLQRVKLSEATGSLLPPEQPRLLAF